MEVIQNKVKDKDYCARKCGRLCQSKDYYGHQLGRCVEHNVGCAYSKNALMVCWELLEKSVPGGGEGGGSLHLQLQAGISSNRPSGVEAHQVSGLAVIRNLFLGQEPEMVRGTRRDVKESAR
eukprot:1158611-Pelagomonas_calceolata.AAC.4